MFGLNIELTTICPLHCPQCYCSLLGGKNIPLEIAKEKINEAAEHKVKFVNLSGGETLCYPQLYDLISYISEKNIKPSVALSGWNFDETVLNKLEKSGIWGIFISLNGSTKEINSLSRNGYDYAINALEILSKSNFKNTFINWVMSSDNYFDFPNIIKIAEKYSISYIEIIAIKPDSNNQLNSFPNSYQILKVANEIKNYTGPVKILAETCFPQMQIALKYLGYNNIPSFFGCMAATKSYNISVDGKYTPCRHLNIPEEFDNLDEYLNKSKVVRSIKDAEKNIQEPCSSCRFGNVCKPCLAINQKTKGKIYIGHNTCDLWK